jgi:DNA-binding LacI/PurR family transcriptional regulator
VSQTAVSLVLNGKTAEHGIAKETELKVLAAMRKLGYVPNLTAQALRRGRSGLIGVHTFEPLFPTKGTYYDEFMIGIQGQAIQSGQDLVLFTSVNQKDSDQSIYRGEQNRLHIADGAIILGFNQHDDELVRLTAEGYPFVFIGRRESAANLMPYVAPDYTTAVSSAVDRAHQLGHRRAAYLGLDDRAEPRAERLDAFRSACARNGITVTDETMAGYGEVTDRWLAEVRAAGTTVAFVESATHLEEVAACCARAAVRIPEQMSVIGLDSIEPEAVTTHSWTHMTVARRAIGARAVELLLDVLDGRRDIGHHEQFPCGFEPGATLGPPPRTRIARPRATGERRGDHPAPTQQKDEV